MPTKNVQQIVAHRPPIPPLAVALNCAIGQNLALGINLLCSISDNNESLADCHRLGAGAESSFMELK
jgi:hypothetical protein